LQEAFVKKAEEQNRRHAEAQSNLWNFNFDHASSSKQQQMARSAFFEAQNRFEGAQSDDEQDGQGFDLDNHGGFGGS